jgi:DNA polymerase I
VAERDASRTLYLLDGTSNIFRAFYAIRRLSSPSGKPTNATFGFTQMVRKLLQEETPEYLAVVFDRPEPTHRHEFFPQYKANRLAPPEDLILQIPDIKSVCEVLGLPQVEMAGFEADDLMGTLAHHASRDGYRVVIVSTDKDLLQLVDDSVQVLHPVKGELLDAEGVRRSFGVPPDKVVEVLALMGDSSDNVPGVPGIGEKGAKDLISRYGSLEECLAHASEIPRKSYRESLIQNQDQARASRELVRIRLDAPVIWEPERFRRGEVRTQEVRRLFGELGFTRILSDFSIPDAAAAPAARVPEEPVEPPLRLEELRSATGIRDFLAGASRTGRLALAPRFSSDEPMRSQMAGLGLSIEPGSSAYIAFAETAVSPSALLTGSEAMASLAPVLASTEVRKIVDGLKMLQVHLLRHGIQPAGELLDPGLAAYLLDSERRDYSLAVLESTYLSPGAGGKPAPPDTEARPKRPFPDSREQSAAGAARDCQVLLDLEEPLLRRLEEERLQRLYRDVESPLLAILAEMEWTGVLVDVRLLGEISREWKQELRELEERIHALAGGRFNINSPLQLREVLFDRLKLRPGRKTEKERQYSTGMDVLEELAGSHPLPATILEYRSLSKLLSTYAEALPRLVHPETGRVHASFNQTAAATGRLSSSNPNLQNIPVRTEKGRQIRKAFVAREGWRILTADYSQIELRVLAHLSGDPEMARAFRSGEDIHARTAAQVFGVAPPLVTSEMRRQAKAINFGILYGMGSFRLARELGVAHPVARSFIEEYFQRFSGVKQYVDGVVERAVREGRVFTLFGRIRAVPEIQSRNANMRRQGIRVAVNTTVQGTAADLIKMAMIRLNRALKDRRLSSRLLIQVHDELLLEVPEAELTEVSALVKDAMERVHPLDVPLLADVGSGPNWMETS